MLRTEGGHCHMTFKNGYTLSMFNGFGSYTENHYNHRKFKEIYMSKNPNPYDNVWESEKIEIAILYGGEFVTQNILHTDDSVTVVKNVDELAKIINKVSKLK